MKRFQKVVLSFLLVVILGVGFSLDISAEQSQLEKIIDFAKSKIGSTEYVGRCQAFVYQCYKAGGIDKGSASSAIEAWKKWGVSTSKSNIPLGACVYFDENVGSQYGHVGIYVGDNKMIHSRQSVGKVVESSMTWYLNNCYLGWGWQGGVQPNSNKVQDTTSTVVSDYYLLTSPDGVQTMRSSYSTSASKIIDIPAKTIVCVTKYSPDGKWGYVKYNGKSGWIRLYYVEKHAHSYGSWETIEKATCTSSGVKKQMCGCGLYKTSTISALGHDYSPNFTVDEKPTCTVNGSKSYHCTRCFAKKNTTVISATGHDYSSATCTKAKTCKVCGATSGSKLGHSYTNACDKSCNRCGTTRSITHNYSAATCTKAKTCTVCGVTSGSKLGHKYTNSCDKSCNRCKATRSITHKYKTTTTKATLTKNGKIVKKCSVCGSVYSTKTIKYAKTFKLSATSYTYNGKVKTPTITVKDSSGKTLKKNTDYTVTYASGRKNVGTYKVTIKMKGNYSGTKTLTFKINPPKTAVSKLTSGKKSITVAITKKATQVTGYQIQYSTSKKFTNAKTKTITSYKTTKYTLKSLSAKKTYYVRVRTYKTVNGKKYYSGWSAIKYTKTK